MQRMFFRVVAVLSLTLFCYSLHSQTTDPPAFSFSAPHRVLTGAASQPGHSFSLVATDLNGDGNTDLFGQMLYASGNGGENFFLTGDGNGEFILNVNSNTNDPNNVQPFPGYGNSPAATFVDFNRDGNADTMYIDPGYYTSDYCPTEVEGSINVYLGDGKGNFTADGYKSYIDPTGTTGEAIGDFNNDSLQDVALLTYEPPQPCDFGGNANLQILLNNGDGTFTTRYAYQNNIYISAAPSHLVTGDFNGDGKLDVAFVGRASYSSTPSVSGNVIQVLFGNGDGTFKLGPIYTVDTAIDNIMAADLNGDGKTDLVILTEPKSPSTQYRIATLLAKQGGGFYWAFEQTSANPLTLIGLMDLNNDGKPDLVYYSYDSSTQVTSLDAYPGLGSGKFGSHQLIRNLAPNENDIIAPLKTGGPLDIFYALSYPPNKNVYLYEMLNQSK